MPTYEYRCTACGHEFEKFQKMSDEPIRDCPECGQESAERVISSGAGLIFKGPGFYATDYRKEKDSGNGSRAEKGSAEGGDGGSDDSGGGDAGDTGGTGGIGGAKGGDGSDDD